MLHYAPSSTSGMERNVSQFVAPMIVLASIQIVQHTPTNHIIIMPTAQLAKIIPLKSRTAIAQTIKTIRSQFAMNGVHRIVCFDLIIRVFLYSDFNNHDSFVYSLLWVEIKIMCQTSLSSWLGWWLLSLLYYRKLPEGKLEIVNSIDLLWINSIVNSIKNPNIRQYSIRSVRRNSQVFGQIATFTMRALA